MQSNEDVNARRNTSIGKTITAIISLSVSSIAFYCHESGSKPSMPNSPTKANRIIIHMCHRHAALGRVPPMLPCGRESISVDGNVGGSAFLSNPPVLGRTP